MLIVVEFEGGDALSNLTLFNNSFEPRGCSVGDEQYTIIDSRTVKLSHLLVACFADISLAAQVYTLLFLLDLLILMILLYGIFIVASRYRCCIRREYHYRRCIK